MKTLHVKTGVFAAALAFSAVALQPTAEAAYTPLSASGNVVINGDFESSPFGSGWTLDLDADEHPGLVPGSNKAVLIGSAASGDFEQAFSGSSLVSNNWTLDFLIASVDPGNSSARSLNLLIPPRTGQSAAIHLRINGDGDTQLLQSSTFITVNSTDKRFTFSIDADNDDSFAGEGDTLNVHRMRIVGNDWGTANATFDVLLSPANDLDNLQVLTLGSTVFGNATPTSAANNSVSDLIFRSTSSYGKYVLDNVWLGDTADVPEPAAVTLLGLAGFGLLGRRMRRQG